MLAFELTLKDIPGYEGQYACTRDGKVWSYPKKGGSKKGKFLKQKMNQKTGYMSICLGRKDKNGSSVHRLIAITYIPNPDNKPQVNHKNRIKHDNRLENLEWITPGDNIKHSWANGVVATEKQIENAKKQVTLAHEIRKRKVMQITKEGILCRVYDSVTEATLITGIKSIGMCALGMKYRKTSGGFIWKYL